MGHITLPPLTTVVQQITIKKCKVIITGVETSPCKLLAATRHVCMYQFVEADMGADQYRHGGPDWRL